MAASNVKFQILVTFVCILCVFHPSESDCNINPASELTEKVPLFLLSGDTVVPDGTAFLLPRMNAPTSTLFAGQEVRLSCAGANNRFNLSGEVRNVNFIEGHCVSDSNFNLNQEHYSLSEIRCTQSAESSVRQVGSCAGGNRRLQIGFPLPQNEFINLIDICFNESRLIPTYLNYTLAEGIERRQTLNELDKPDKSDYYNGLPNHLQHYYTCSNQETIVGSLLGSQPLARESIRCSDSSNFLVKTYLAPCNDFVYISQQISSKYQINTFPMWLSITNGNWEKLENEIRLYASNVSRDSSDLIIYTGTLGVTTLVNQRRRQTPIYLDSGNKLPVPQWVWKLVYEPQVQEGIVFILVNNPYQLRFLPCSCVCPRTKWTLEWNRQDRSKGYIYCCTVEGFRRVNPELPPLQVTGLLTKNRPYNPFGIDVEPQK